MEATNPKIKSDIQQLDVNSDLVELFSLDATKLGGTIFYFTSMTDQNQPILFNGITYEPLPVRITGINRRGDKGFPRPVMEVANVLLTFVGLIDAYNDGLGAKVTRTRTYSKYIDGHSAADSGARFPEDVFYIEQLLEQNKKFLKWELVCPMDIGDRVVPKNQVIRYCQHRYRVYREGAFNTTISTCPYDGTNYFTRAGVATSAANDVCGKKLSDCILRYPLKTDQLPFFGFPLVGQIGRTYR